MCADTSRKIRITNTTIGSLRAGQGVQFIRDTDLRGFQVKVLPSGKSVYQVEARLGGTGKVKKFKIAEVDDITLQEARKKAQDALGKIREGIDPLLEKRLQLHEGKTLQQLMKVYFEVRDLKPRTQARYEYLAHKQFGSWLNRRVSDITKHEIQDWYAKGNKKKAMTDGAYRFLSSLMTFAMGCEVIAENPCKLVTNAKMRYKIKARTDHVEINHDLPLFLKAFVDFQYLRDSQRVARDAILLILASGLRFHEAASLTWKQVDFKRKIITITDTKNKHVHIVPMVPTTLAMLIYRARHAEKSPFVFRIKGETKTRHITSFQKTLAAICKAANVPVVTAHDLRRTFATVLNSIGVGYVDAKFLMNHRAKDITSQYMQPDIENMRGHLYRVVDHYDNKIPYFPTGQGCSPYASGVIKYVLYQHGDVTPEPVDPAESHAAWQRHSEDELWKD